MLGDVRRERSMNYVRYDEKLTPTRPLARPFLLFSVLLRM